MKRYKIKIPEPLCESNCGKYKYFQPIYNDLLYRGNDEITYSKFLREILEYTEINPLDDVLFIRGSIEEFKPFQIGGGAESRVINNTPFSVLKILKVSPSLMQFRNYIPTAVPSRLRVIVWDDEDVYYIYIQAKVKPVTEEDTNYAFKRLDTVMMKYGFSLVVGYSDEQVRVYTNGFIIIDDVHINNLGFGIDDKVHIIDCSIYDINIWEEQMEYKVPNKIPCIIYNNEYPLEERIRQHLKEIAESFKNLITEKEIEFDKILASHNIEAPYIKIR